MNALIRINLLDWREAMREQRRRNFFGALVLTALVSAAIIGFVTVFIYGNRIEAQQERNQYLERQIHIAEQKLVKLKQIKAERASLIRRMQIIEDLQQSRSWIVHFFDQLVATLPDGVYLTSLSQHNNSTTLKGVAKSNARVSQFMVNLDNSPWLENPKLIVIKSGDNKKHSAVFTLRVEHQQPQRNGTSDHRSAS